MATRTQRETADTSGFTDVDWVELRKLRDAWEIGGQEALAIAQKKLRQADPIRWFKLVRAFYPHLMRKVVGDDDASPP